MKERQFAAYINQKNSTELRREMNTLQKELDAMHKRSDELSADYNTEQKMLEETIPEKESRLEDLKVSAANVEAFIEKAKRYTAINELTPELLRLFIQRIEIGERTVKYSRHASQSIRIIYRDIGDVDSAMEPGERQPEMALPLPSVSEWLKMLA